MVMNQLKHLLKEKLTEFSQTFTIETDGSSGYRKTKLTTAMEINEDKKLNR